MIFRIRIRCVGMTRAIRCKRIHQPELYVLNICRFKVIRCKRPHDPSPSSGRIVQITISRIKSGGIRTVIVVVNSSFVWIIRHIKHPYKCGLSGSKIFIRKQFRNHDLSLSVIVLNERVVGNVVRGQGIVVMK